MCTWGAYKVGTLTVNNELRPQITSFKVRVGAHPKPSMEFCRNNDKQISPVTDMFGCHSFVRHFTFGGYKKKIETNNQLVRFDWIWCDTHTVILYSSGTLMLNLNLPSFQKPSSGVMVNENSLSTLGSAKLVAQVLGRFCSISWTSLTSKRSLTEIRFVFSLDCPAASFFNLRVNVIILLILIIREINPYGS